LRALAALVVATVAIVGLGQWFLFRSKVTTDVYLAQVPFEFRYRLVSSKTGDVISEDVDGWYVEGRYIIGSEGPHRYYLFDRVCLQPWHFRDVIELSGALERLDIVGYAWSREEGTADLVFEHRQSAFRNSRLAPGAPRCRTQSVLPR
jgi:hypothetical protein